MGILVVRRTITKLIVVTVLLLAAPLAVEAEQSRKAARLGVLAPGDLVRGGAFVEVFKGALREHGWVEGENLVIEYRFGDERYEHLRALADELVRLNVDLIFAASAPAAQAAKAATATIPIVFATLNDPVRAGFVASFAHPGGNMTGPAAPGPELDSKRLELLKEIVPSLSRATVLVNPSNPMTPQRLRAVEDAAKVLKVELRLVRTSDAKQLDEALRVMARAKLAGLIVFEDPMLIANRKRIIDFAAQRRIPALYTSSGWAEEGGLLEYATSSRELTRRAVMYVDRVLRGAKPADLPVELPTRFELVINLRTARALGLTIPAALLLRADRVIE